MKAHVGSITPFVTCLSVGETSGEIVYLRCPFCKPKTNDDRRICLSVPFRVSLSGIIVHWRIINVSKIQVACNTQDICALITLVVGQQTGYGNNAVIYAPCLLKCTRFSHGTKKSFCSENLYGFPKLKKQSVNKSVFLDTQ